MGLKGGVLGGAIGGIVAGIVDMVVGYSFTLMGLIGITEPILMEEFPLPVSIIIVGSIVISIISGIIFGAIYSRLYPSIPGKALTKGVYYGLLIWIIKDIVAAMYMVVPYGAHYMAFDFVAIGLPMWLVCGAVLAAIYERIK